MWYLPYLTLPLMTTQQVKKQYDSYITFFSNQLKKVVTIYVRSLFFGHCDDPLCHYFEFVNKAFDKNLKI